MGCWEDGSNGLPFLSHGIGGSTARGPRTSRSPKRLVRVPILLPEAMTARLPLDPDTDPAGVWERFR